MNVFRGRFEVQNNFKLPLEDVYIGRREFPDPLCTGDSMVFTEMNS